MTKESHFLSNHRGWMAEAAKRRFLNHELCPTSEGCYFLSSHLPQPSAWTRWPQPEREKQADETENTHLEYKGLTSGWILDNLHLGQYTKYWSEVVTQHRAME